jgi:hypothetical protein
MALNFADKPKAAKKDFGRAEDGAYSARICQLIDFGKQYATDFQTGEIKKYDDGNEVIQHKVWITFEFPTETIEVDGVDKPRWYGKEYTVSMHEKAALTALLKAADPKGEHTAKGRNVKGLLGLPVMVTIGSTKSGKAKVSAVTSIPKGMQVDPLVNPETFFDLDSDDIETFKGLPNWMQDRIKTGVDFDDTHFYQAINAKDLAENVDSGSY